MSQIQKKKFERTTAEQLAHYVQFCELHPEILGGKSNPTCPARQQDLWVQLSGELNSQRGPTRTWAKWKETMGIWRSQLRSRARKRKAETMVTGGGPYGGGMSTFEERALSVFVAAAVDGLREVPVLGLEPIVSSPSSTDDNSSHAISSPPNVNAVQDNSASNTSVDTSPPYGATPPPYGATPPPYRATTPPFRTSTPVRRNQRRNDVLELLYQSLQRREQRDAQLAESLSSLAQSVGQIAEALATTKNL